MSIVPGALHEGYVRFRHGRYQTERSLYAQLAEGQAPRVALLGCADSRANPDMIFDAEPGDMFILRNVANLVPDYEPDSGFHGTSAGIEFAVRYLKVEHLVIMGHASCGGIKACIDHDGRGISAGVFIDHWVDLASKAFAEVRANNPNLGGEELQRAVEFTSIRHSLARLATFPFIAEAVAAGTLRLHGSWFAIATGELRWLDPATGDFRRIDEDTLADKGPAAYI